MDVCIIYSRRNVEVPPALEAILSPRWSVWWDDKISGDYRVAIEEAISAAKCVIPIWSADSRKSRVVFDEAKLAERSGVPLLPIIIEKDIQPPLGFGSIDTIDLSDWTGGADHPGIQRLIRKLNTVVPALAGPRQRLSELVICGRTIPCPTFFFSVSSHETQLKPEDALQALALFGSSTVLVSAYDMIRGKRSAKMIEALERCRAAGASILLDSGNYEASRRGDRKWSAKMLHDALANTPHDWAFCFDRLNPQNDPDALVRSVVEAVERDARHTTKPMLPIVHAPRLADGEYAVAHIPAVMRRIAAELRPPLLAIPERELGPGIIERAKTVYRIRRELDQLDFYQALHILGTGNPLSIAILAAAGGDSFDGLEWCRVVADAETYRLYHFQHYDFFAYQTAVAKSGVARVAVSSQDINYGGKVVFHNLDFFSSFLEDLRIATNAGKLVRFLSVRLPTGSMEQLEQVIPEVF